MKVESEKWNWVQIATAALLGLLTYVYFPDALGHYPIGEYIFSFFPEHYREISPGRINLVGLVAGQFVSGFVAGGLYSGETIEAIKRGYIAGAVSYLVPFFVAGIFVMGGFFLMALKGAVGTFILIAVSTIVGVGLTSIIVLIIAVVAGIAGGLGHLLRKSLP